jgi:gamma-glutamylcyclotransferase (GGCT)/AIG2-like uncharacterized protein YtfP
MRGLEGANRLDLAGRLRFVGPCVVPGQLFDLGPYPGLRHGHGQVIGELHALLDLEAVAILDAFEGYSPTAPRESLYLRERVGLLEPKGAEAWIYIYNTVPDARARIALGDWRAHLAARGEP